MEMEFYFVLLKIEQVQAAKISAVDHLLDPTNLGFFHSNKTEQKFCVVLHRIKLHT